MPEETDLWYSVQGPIRISEMNDQHLRNSIHLIERRFLICSGQASDQYDAFRKLMAYFSDSALADDELRGIDEEVDASYVSLCREALKRRLEKVIIPHSVRVVAERLLKQVEPVDEGEEI